MAVVTVTTRSLGVWGGMNQPSTEKVGLVCEINDFECSESDLRWTYIRPVAPHPLTRSGRRRRRRRY